VRERVERRPADRLRFVQGLAGAGGIVIARAVVRDMRSGAAASRLFSSLMLVTGLGPILAPVIGGQLLALTSWEGIFLLLTVLSGCSRCWSSSPCRRRCRPSAAARTAWRVPCRSWAELLRDRAFLGYALAGGLTFGALFAYISGSSFVLQRIYGLSPQLFSLAFAMNGLGLIAASQVNAHIVERFGPKRLLRGALDLRGRELAGAADGRPDRRPARVGPARPDVRDRLEHPVRAPEHDGARARRPRERGGLGLGAARRHQFMIGALAAPLVGVAGPDSAVPMGIVMVTLALGALVPSSRRPAAPLDGRAMTLVTISASYGCGGSRIAPALAERLGVPLLGRPPAPDPRPRGRGAQRPPAVARRVARAGVGTPGGMGLDELLPDSTGATRSSARSASSPPAARA
jgi:DHA1 family bicyclomycin/chloramphenicol resistance-like MFS transporter